MNNKKPYPLPKPTSLTKPFWNACQAESLEVSVCNNCEHMFLPGGPVCPKCWSNNLVTKAIPGVGEIFSFAIYRRTYHPAIPAPYVVAIIRLSGGVSLVSNVIGCEPEDVEVGMPVDVVFEQESGMTLPRFRPVTPSDAPTSTVTQE